MRAYRLYLASRFGEAACLGLVYTTIVIYRVDVAGLNPLQLVLVGTALEAAYFAFQLPTGVYADTRSRRGAVIAGLAILGVGCLVEGLSPVFLGILAAQVIGALGYALVSGAQEAWIAAEVGTADLTRVYLRGSQAALVGGLCGTALSGLVAGVRVNLPLLVGGGALVALAVALVFTMPETRPTPAAAADAGPDVGSDTGDVEDVPHRESPIATVRTTCRAIRIRPAFLLVFAAVAVVAAWSEAVDRLWGAHLIEDYTLPTIGHLESATWLSVITLAATLLGLLVTQVVSRYVDDSRTLPTLLGLVAGLGVATVVLALAGNVWPAIVAAIVISAARSAYYPVLDSWLVQRTEDSHRATMLSAKDMFDAGGQTAFGPVLGAIGTLASLRAALTVSAAALAPAIALLLTAVRRKREDPGRP